MELGVGCFCTSHSWPYSSSRVKKIIEQFAIRTSKFSPRDTNPAKTRKADNDYDIVTTFTIAINKCIINKIYSIVIFGTRKID
jgi:hypothetical protein